MNLTDYLKQERGRGAALARVLSVTPVTVSQWSSGDRQVPAERCPAIERATGGQVRCEELRPDVDWKYLRASAVESNSMVEADPDAGRIEPLAELP
ncbi:transcriptional regulator [Lysobacteraceae bacterium NML91-0213]|nr:transcriptional regulator [Xanthomonadaceae bacterium NML91-0213]